MAINLDDLFRPPGNSSAATNIPPDPFFTTQGDAVEDEQGGVSSIIPTSNALAPVDIANLALSRAGARKQIASLSENSEEALAAKSAWTHAHMLVLEEADWSFARARRALDPHGTPPSGWSYSYLYPVDCIVARRILPDGYRTDTETTRIPFEVETHDEGRRVIYTNHPDATLVYTRRIEDTKNLPASYVDALAWFLASELVIPLSLDMNRQTLCLQMYQRSLLRAMARVGNERTEEPPDGGEFVRARL